MEISNIIWVLKGTFQFSQQVLLKSLSNFPNLSNNRASPAFFGSPLNLATWQKQQENHPSPFSGGVFLAMEQRSDWLTRVLYTGAVLGGATFAAIAARFVLTQPFFGGEDWGRGTVNIGSRVKIPTFKQTSKEAESSFFLDWDIQTIHHEISCSSP